MIPSLADASFAFLGFAGVVILVFRLSRSHLWRRIVLTAANLTFLFLVSPSIKQYIPLLAFVGFGFVGVRLIQRGRRGAFLPVLIGLIAMFVWLKKYTFVPTAMFLPFPYRLLGISYVLFRLVRMVVDAHNEALTTEVGLVPYFNYTLNFVTLVSGPIQSYQDFYKTQTDTVDLLDMGEALERIVVGLFKSSVLAMMLSAIQKWAMAELAGSPIAPPWLLGLLVFGSYPLFLYCNFSGYIDIVIGVGTLLGFRLPENFDRPFSSDNFLNFWSRWHITLSETLKIYVYNPLVMALMRRSPSGEYDTLFGVFSYFVTFFLIGFWHGQTSEFLFFGFLQGFGAAANKLFQVVMLKKLGRSRNKSLSANPFYCAITRGLTFTWFAFTLIWFWSTWTRIGRLQSELGWAAMAAAWLAIFVAATVLLALWEEVRKITLSWNLLGTPIFQSRYLRTAVSTAMLAIVVVILVILDQPAPDIVYKAF